jgi:predicted component of type VI protein secretion system
MNFINSIIAAIDSWDGETEIEVDLSLNTNIDDSIDGFYDEGGMLDQINKDLEDQIQNTEEAIKEIDRQMKYLDAVYNGGLTGWMTEDLSSQDKNKLKRELDKEIERYHVINQ